MAIYDPADDDSRERLVNRKLYECGSCGAYHPQDWDGDCRDDLNRIYEVTIDDEIISMEEQMARIEGEEA